MTNEATETHLTRRAGQRWRAQNIDKDWGGEWVLDARGPMDDRWIATHESGMRNCHLTDTMWTEGKFTMTLLAPAPTAIREAPDRSGCKAWCGHMVSEDCVPWSDGNHNVLSGNRGRPVGGQRFDVFAAGHHYAFDSQACADARVPALAPSPPTTAGGSGENVTVELPKSPLPFVRLCTGCLIGVPHARGHTCKPASNDLGTGIAVPVRSSLTGAEHEVHMPVPATCDCARDTHSGPVTLRYLPPQAKGGPAGTWACEECALWWEKKADAGGIGTSYLHDPKRPELLPRARLSFAPYDDDFCAEVG